MCRIKPLHGYFRQSFVSFTCRTVCGFRLTAYRPTVKEPMNNRKNEGMLTDIQPSQKMIANNPRVYQDTGQALRRCNDE